MGAKSPPYIYEKEAGKGDDRCCLTQRQANQCRIIIIIIITLPLGILRERTVKLSSDQTLSHDCRSEEKDLTASSYLVLYHFTAFVS
jgi:hypothetical protein